jgi:pimeloyl-ACP methyl ester carboxylesterase
MKAATASETILSCDDAGTGPPVVLLHAFPFSRAMWRPQVEALHSSYRVITPDLRGFGGSAPFTGTPSVDTMADDVAALLDALGASEPVVLGGLSMGGYVSLAFARRHGQRLRGLILADTRAEPDGPEARANRDRMIAFARDHSAADVVEQLLPKLLGERTRATKPDVVDEVRRIGSAQPVHGVITALQAMRDRPDATAVLANVSVPTLVLVGAEDTATPLAAAQVLATGIRGARLVTIADAGHLSSLECPGRFNEAVSGFLQALPPSH